MNWSHFTKEEFSCKCGCGANEVKTDLINRLEIVRQMYGKPMRINSGHRCEQANRAAGSRSSSSHVIGEAADIGCTNSKDRDELVGYLRTQFQRMGIHKLFIHVDISEIKKASPVMWVY